MSRRTSGGKNFCQALEILEKQAFRCGRPWPEGADVHDPRGVQKNFGQKNFGLNFRSLINSGVPTKSEHLRSLTDWWGNPVSSSLLRGVSLPDVLQKPEGLCSVARQMWGVLSYFGVCNQDFHSCYRSPRTPKGFWRVSEGVSEEVSEEVSEGFWKGPRTCQPKDPSKRLQEPFENPSRRCRSRWCVRLPGA